MNDLQTRLNKIMKELPLSLLVSKIKDKLAAQGVRLTKRQESMLLEKTTLDLIPTVRLHWWQLFKNRSIKLQINAQDGDDIEKTLQSVLDNMPEIITGMVDELLPPILEQLLKRSPKGLSYERKQLNAFRKRLYRTWELPLRHLEIMIAFAKELGDSVNEQLRKDTKEPYVVEVLTRLHGRACQVASEILLLLQNGLPNGALARWRTLHELCVVLFLIMEGGENLAKAYRLHADVETFKAAVEYEKYYSRLGFEGIEDNELHEMKTHAEALEKEYGPSFPNQYGWAAEHIKNKKPTFADLEKHVGIDHLRPYYRIASHDIHANPKGVFFKFGLMNESDYILIGPTDYGLADAGQNAALSLSQATTAILSLNPNLDSIVAMRLLISLAEMISSDFAGIQNEMEEAAQQIVGVVRQDAAE